MDKLKQHLKKILSSDLGQALSDIEQKLKPNTISYDDFIILQSRYTKMKKNEMLGILAGKDLDTQHANLTKAVLDYVNILPHSDMLDNNPDDKEEMPSKSTLKENKVFTGSRAGISIELGNLFQTDLHNVPNESFKKISSSKNVIGENVFLFKKTLDIPEFGIFHEVQVNLIAGRTRNVFFYNYNPDVVNPNKIKSLINSLYTLMGEDDDGKADFSPQDLEDYNSETLYVLFGRNWREHPKHRNPVALVRFEDHASLGIWGIEI